FNYIYLVQEAIDDAEASPTYTAMKRVVGNCEAKEGVYIFSTNQALQKKALYELVANTSVVSSGGGTPVVKIITNTQPYG
ncbi:hypothetical protein LAJ55_15665, partial [Streptococcus pneumoniae]|uniref:hypothetical protein n=1 Tax=Streptococcus pneumoniae TaxID=1313 RepID=UPI001CBDFCA3